MIILEVKRRKVSRKESSFVLSGVEKLKRQS